MLLGQRSRGGPCEDPGVTHAGWGRGSGPGKILTAPLAEASSTRAAVGLGPILARS